MKTKRIYFNISELNLLLSGITVFCCFLVITRIIWTFQLTYISLIWNLFLAWIPYILSYLFHKKWKVIKNRLLWYSWIFIWMIFYPNAPYIITDLFHLNERYGAPIWFDLILIYSFAGIGLILGLLSLWDMHNVFLKKYSKKTGWWFVIISLCLSGFGIYMGRYLRWNSWDIIARTSLLFSDVWYILVHPVKNLKAIGFTILFAGFQIIIYYSFYKYNILQKQQIHNKLN